MKNDATAEQINDAVVNPRVVYIFIALHLIIALPLAYLLNIWVDEASTLHTTDHGLIYAFQHVFADEKQAPFYFLALSLWRELNSSIFFARLFSVICSVLAIKVFYNLAYRFWKDKTAILITVIFAAHPYLIWASLEIRLYSLVILFSALLLKFFFEGYLDSERKTSNAASSANQERRARIYFTVLAIISLYINYYLGFLLVGFFLALLILRRWQAAKDYFIQMLIVGLSILPLLWTIQQQFAARAIAFNEEKPIIDGIKTLWNHFLVFVLPTELFPTTGELTILSFIRLWLVRLAILAVLFVLIKTKGKYLDESTIVLTVVSAICSLFLLCVYLILGIKYIEIRHSVNAFVPLILFWGLLLSRILPKKAWILVAAVYLIFFSYAIYMLYPNHTKRGDWARVAAYIEQNEKPNQPIIVFRNYEALTLPYYYRGINKILPNDKFFAWEQEGTDNSPDAFKMQTEYILSTIPTDAPEIWLLTDDTCQSLGTKGGCQPLENYLEANYTVEDTKDFYLQRVRLLRKKQND